VLPPSVREVARKELVEILRDKRSLFVLILLPVFLYPVLMIGTGLMASAQLRKLQGRTYTVWVDDLDQLPAALRAELEQTPDAEDGARGQDDKASQLKLELVATPVGADPDAALSEGGASAVLQGVAGATEAVARGEQVQLEVLYNGGVDTSSLTRRRVEDAIETWSDAIAADRVSAAGLTSKDLAPAITASRDRGKPGALLGRMLAALVVILAITGSSRVQIAMGKVLAVFVVSLASALFNLLSLSITFSWFGSMMPKDGGSLAVDWTLVPVMLIVMIPLVALFSALSLAASTFAASNKEAQAFLTPLLIGGMAPAMLTAIPGFELTATMCLTPVAGPALLLKELLAGTASANQVLLVTGSSLVYAALCVRWVASLYEQEEVLWRPAAAGAPDLLGLQRRKGHTPAQPLPTLPQALLAGVVVLLLVAMAGTKIQAWHLVWGLVATLVGLVALPCLAYARLLGCDLRQTFALHRPAWPFLAVTVLLAVGGITVNLDLIQTQTDFNVSQEQLEELAKATAALTSLPLWALVLLMAVLPGVCEEIAYRGFVLRGLLKEGGPTTAILTSSLLFAMAHMDPARILPTFFVGAVLGYLSWRSNSLIPAMVLHALYNGSLVVVSHMEWIDPTQPPSWGLRLTGWACLLAGLAFLTWYRPARPAPETPQPPMAE
jgi:sodium transport system permease protein